MTINQYQSKVELPYVENAVIKGTVITMEVVNKFNGGSAYTYVGKVHSSFEEFFHVEDRNKMYVLLLTYKHFLDAKESSPL